MIESATKQRPVKSAKLRVETHVPAVTGANVAAEVKDRRMS
jgi:hypothetical protein